VFVELSGYHYQDLVMTDSAQTQSQKGLSISQKVQLKHKPEKDG